MKGWAYKWMRLSWIVIPLNGWQKGRMVPIPKGSNQRQHPVELPSSQVLDDSLEVIYPRRYISTSGRSSWEQKGCRKRSGGTIDQLCIDKGVMNDGKKNKSQRFESTRRKQRTWFHTPGSSSLLKYHGWQTTSKGSSSQVWQDKVLLNGKWWSPWRSQHQERNLSSGRQSISTAACDANDTIH